MLHVILAFKQVPIVVYSSYIWIGQYLQVQILLVATFSLAKKVETNILIRWYSCSNSRFRIIAIDYHVQCNTHRSLLSGKAPLFSICCSWILLCLHESDKTCLCLSNLQCVKVSVKILCSSDRQHLAPFTELCCCVFDFQLHVVNTSLSWNTGFLLVPSSLLRVPIRTSKHVTEERFFPNAPEVSDTPVVVKGTEREPGKTEFEN